jgi:hypothetical protein
MITGLAAIVLSSLRQLPLVIAANTALVNLTPPQRRLRLRS